MGQDIQVAPHAAAAVCAGLVYLAVTLLGYCYADDVKVERGHRFRRLLTFYNLFVASFYMLQAILLLEVLGADGSLLGLDSTNSARGIVVIRVHALSRVLAVVDTVLLLSSSRRSRIKWGFVYHNAVILALWGFVLDNRSVLEMGPVRVVGLLNSLLYTLVHLYWAASVWVKDRACIACVCLLAQLVLHCALVVTSVAVLIRVNQSDDAQTASFVLWCLHGAIMLASTMHVLLRNKRASDDAVERAHQTEIEQE